MGVHKLHEGRPRRHLKAFLALFNMQNTCPLSFPSFFFFRNFPTYLQCIIYKPVPTPSHKPSAFSSTSGCPVHLCIAFINSKSPTKFNWCCLHVHGCGVSHWVMNNHYDSLLLFPSLCYSTIKSIQCQANQPTTVLTTEESFC